MAENVPRVMHSSGGIYVGDNTFGEPTVRHFRWKTLARKLLVCKRYLNFLRSPLYHLMKYRSRWKCLKNPIVPFDISFKRLHNKMIKRLI